MFRRMQTVGFMLLTTLSGSYLLFAQTTPQAAEEKKLVVDEPPKVSPEKPMSFWMRSKLNASKTILEALAQGDFEKLESNSEQMRLIGKLEGFVRRSNPSYKAQLHTFDLANQELIRQAKRKNVEGATLAFNQLTSSCVACHVMLRDGVE